MKNLLIIALLMLAWSAGAQIPTEPIPDSYGPDFERARQQPPSSPDTIRLDPIEQVPIAPSLFALTSGNWAWQYYSMPSYSAHIKANAKGKVVVFIFDTAGRGTDAEALAPYCWPEKDRVFTGEPPQDGHGHGLHVGSCIAAKHPGGLRMGIASDLAEAGKLRLVFYKVLQNGGSGAVTGIVNGINAAVQEAKLLQDQGWKVVFNLSLGGSGTNAQMDAALQKAWNAGIYVCAASGNNGARQISTPANGPGAQAIGAIDAMGARANFSNYGPGLFSVAPGVRIFGVFPKSATGYAELSGTSMASPTEAGLVATTWALHPAATNGQLKAFFTAENSNGGSFNDQTGYGSAVMDAIKNADFGNVPDPDPEPDPCDPCPDPDEPDPEPDPEPRPKRTFDIQLTKPFTVNWRPDGGQARTDKVVLSLEWLSTENADWAALEAETWTFKFFAARGFVLNPDDDEAEMVYWVRHFYELIAKQQGYKVKAEVKWVTPDGSLMGYDKARRPLRAKLKKMKGEASTIGAF